MLHWITLFRAACYSCCFVSFISFCIRKRERLHRRLLVSIWWSRKNAIRNSCVFQVVGRIRSVCVCVCLKFHLFGTCSLANKYKECHPFPTIPRFHISLARALFSSLRFLFLLLSTSIPLASWFWWKVEMPTLRDSFLEVWVAAANGGNNLQSWNRGY